jgi:hypothetical protein
VPTVPEVADAAVELARDGDRDRAVRRLRELAGDRACLEATRDYFVARLHRRQDDYDATRGLQLVIKALQEMPFTNGQMPYPRLDEPTRRRWAPWKRR